MADAQDRHPRPDQLAPQSVRVTVAVPTYQRPDQLAALLTKLVEQCRGLNADVLVVDNDPLGSAEVVVRRCGAGSVRYIREPRPGLAAVRNRALDAAAGADVMVFIDDDELPSEEWLVTLVRSWCRWRCTAVSGPARRILPPDATWARASGAFERARRPSGVLVRSAATNNLLLDLAAIEALGVRFDDRFGLSGGEDTMFARLLVQRGGTIRWNDEAWVVESVPPHRTRRGWVLRRTFRASTTWSRVRLILARSTAQRVAVRAELVGRGIVRSARGAARCMVGVVRRDLAARARGACEIASGSGMLLGAAGYTYREYARPAPRTNGNLDAPRESLILGHEERDRQRRDMR